MMNALELLRKSLQIETIHTLIGGSMGGMLALEWSCTHPEISKNLILLATTAQQSPWAIAFNETQRMAIAADPTWKKNSPEAGRNGLKAARALALLSYRNYEAYCKTQSETDIEKLDHYKASSYQQYQGEKLVNRFNVASYILLSKAMDSHHLGRSRESVEEALKRIKANTLSIGISSDMLFPPKEQERIAKGINNGVYKEIDSFYGHDGFLVETKAIYEIIIRFYTNNKIDIHARN